MKIGMRGHDLGKLPLIEFMEKARETGIDEIQLAFAKAISDYDFSAGHFSPGFARFVRQNLQKNGLHVPVLGSYINPVAKDPITRKLEIAKFMENMKYAKYIGADMVGTETGDFYEGGYEILIDTMKILIETAEKLGVIIAVEGVTTHTLHSPKVISQFLDDISSPNMQIIFDPANLIDHTNVNQQDIMFDEVFRLYGGKVIAIHLKDLIIEGENKKYVPIGEGVLDYHALFRRLKVRKPHISALIEGGKAETFAKERDYLYAIYNSI
ncbi:MAG: sugar phosphate isomerase/epimerase [Defluviitaleaceae bacterium]|nr:sugar phosphate isomerase/epimerase [Defluviitaleaceae bacterium]